MIQLASCDEETIDYFWRLAMSYIEEDTLGILYSHRQMEYACVLDKITPRPLDTVVDIGCGESMLVLLLAKYASKVYGIDNGSFNNYIEWLDDIQLKPEVQSKQVEIITQSASEIPLPDESVDVVYTISALEHFIDGDDIECAKEVGRVLKHGGYFIGTVDFNPITTKPLGDESFYYAYTLNSFMERIVENSKCTLVGGVHLPENIAVTISTAMFFAMTKI